MSISIILQFHVLVTNEMQTGWTPGQSCICEHITPWIPSLTHISLHGKTLLNPQRKLCRSPPCILLKNPTKSYLFQGWRILNFYRCDVEPRPFVLAKYKRMEQFVFICKAALSQQQSPQLSCYGWITPNPQSISVGVFFYGGKMFTVRMPNSSKEVNWWVNQVCFLESD